jgi:hypothetical protein
MLAAPLYIGPHVNVLYFFQKKPARSASSLVAPRTMGVFVQRRPRRWPGSSEQVLKPLLAIDNEHLIVSAAVLLDLAHVGDAFSVR